MTSNTKNTETQFRRYSKRALKFAARFARGIFRQLYRPSKIKIGDLSISIPPDTTPVIKNVVYMENYERSEIEILREILRPGDVVVEAGSALGFVALNAAAVIGEDRVWMIEANRDLIPIIRKNFSLNGYTHPNIIHGIASSVGACEKQEIRISKNFWSSSVIDKEDVLRIDVVETVDLSKLFKDVNASVFVCDVEGGEFDIVPHLEFFGVNRLVIEIHDPLASIEKRYDFHSALLRKGFVPNACRSRGSVFLFERIRPNSP